MVELAGLYAALPTAFDDAFAYDGKAQAALARHAVRLGMDGVFVGGSTAEVHSLTLPERIEALRDVAAALGPDTKLIAHVAAMRLPDVHELTRAAAELGYAAVASTPPFYLPFNAAERRGYFEELVAASALPVFLYHIPSLTGLDLAQAEILDLLALPGIVGMKLSADDIGLVLRAKARQPEKLVLFGSDDLLLPALAAGADGGVGSTYNLFGRRIVGLRDAVRRASSPRRVAYRRRSMPASPCWSRPASSRRSRPASPLPVWPAAPAARPPDRSMLPPPPVCWNASSPFSTAEPSGA